MMKGGLQGMRKRVIIIPMNFLYPNYEKMYIIKLSTKYKKEFKRLIGNIKILKELYFVISQLQK